MAESDYWRQGPDPSHDRDIYGRGRESFGRPREDAPGDEGLGETRSFQPFDAERRRAERGESYGEGGYGAVPTGPYYGLPPRIPFRRDDQARYGVGRQAFEPDPYTPREGRRDERSAWSGVRDEMASRFGDRDAERHREWDALHYGKGPKGYKRSDARIHEDVNDRLTDDGFIDASDVEVAVSGGEVTLNGFVPDRDSKRRAEMLVERVFGVGHVQNNLRVRDLGRSPYSAGSYRGGGMEVQRTAAGEREPVQVTGVTDGEN